MNVRRTTRVLVALEPGAADERQLEPILRFASRQGATVEGVFVEDRRSFEIVATPHARFIGTSGRDATGFDETALRRAWRVTSVRTRERFAARVERFEARWTFTTRQCAGLAEAFSDATPGDLVVVTLARRARNLARVRDIVDAVIGPLPTSLLVLNDAGTLDRSVIAVFDGDVADLTAAVALSETFACPLTVFDISGPGAGEPDAAVRDVLAQAHRNAELRTFAPNDIGALTEALVAAGAGTIVLDRTGTAVRALDLPALLQRSTASLFIRN